MSAFARYNSVIGTFVLLLLFLLIYMAFSSQPLSGDLTRIGGYLEEDFGWNEPQEAFESKHFVLANSIADLDRRFDVVVVGDSFSADHYRGWQNYLVENTGLSVITFYMAYGFNLAGVIASEEFKKFPPKILIYESVEHLAIQRLHEFSKWDVERKVGGVGFSLDRDVVFVQDFPKKELLRQTQVDLEILFSEASHYIQKSVYRMIGSDKDKTEILSLKRGNLFSNEMPDKLLVLKDEVFMKFSESDITKAVQGLQNAHSLVEENGETKFAFLMFPNKLTAYSPFLDSGIAPVPSVFPVMAEHYTLLRLDQSFQSELQQGAKDLYLPNDTHAGYYGHKVAALGLIDYILQ